MDRLQTTTGQTMLVHERSAACDEHGCVVHNPSDHHMRSWRTHWRDDRGLMERLCEHGVGHPDPDHLAFVARVCGPQAAATESVHGCDGCCAPPGESL